MATDYEQFYQNNPNGLGKPTQAFVDFFESYNRLNASVLDIGCGQGRDAVFIARLGYSVTGVDLSPTGIKDLMSVARQENLNVKGVVADIRECEWSELYDVVVVDRTLHMLAPKEQTNVLETLLNATKSDSHVLIADERCNLPSFKSVIDKSQWDWCLTFENRGFLFVKRL